jgi:isopropylmalate/homocitrate/citramalate synthase
MDQQNQQIAFFDTTLRDGEQSPGCSMTVAEKVRMAHALDELGVDVIEAGFAIASEGDFAALPFRAPAAKTLKHLPARSTKPTRHAFTSSWPVPIFTSNTN